MYALSKYSNKVITSLNSEVYILFEYSAQIFIMVYMFLNIFCVHLQGTFICWSTGEWVKGNVEISKKFTLSEIPVFVKTSSIIPMKPDNFGMCKISVAIMKCCLLDVLGSAQVIPDVLKLMIFPGDV